MLFYVFLAQVSPRTNILRELSNLISELYFYYLILVACIMITIRHLDFSQSVPTSSPGENLQSSLLRHGKVFWIKTLTIRKIKPTSDNFEINNPNLRWNRKSRSFQSQAKQDSACVCIMWKWKKWKKKKKNACTQIINTMITKIVITEHKN